MLKSVMTIAVAAVVLIALDYYAWQGRYTAAALVMLSSIERGFGF